MGKYASVLQRSEPEEHLHHLPEQTPSSDFSQQPTAHRAYAELAAKLFDGAENRRVVAFASVQGGAGVTQTIRGLAVELARERKTVVALDGSLRTFDLPGVPVQESRSRSGAHDGSFTAVSKTQPASTAEFRKQFDIVLLDCGSLEVSVDLLRHAPVADGVVIVVEAGRTTKEQIDRVTRVVDEARGKLIGFVLNKRRYPIPGWLYRLL